MLFVGDFAFSLVCLSRQEQECFAYCDRRTYWFQVKIEFVERFAFYERAKQAYAIVHTG